VHHLTTVKIEKTTSIIGS